MGECSPALITVAKSSCVQILVGLIFMGMVADENYPSTKIYAFTVVYKNIMYICYMGSHKMKGAALML